MEGAILESSDARHTHRIEMLMLAILVSQLRSSTSPPGPVSSNPTTTSSSSSSPTSTSSVARTTSPSPSYPPPYPDLLPSHRTPRNGPHFLPICHI